MEIWGYGMERGQAQVNAKELVGRWLEAIFLLVGVQLQGNFQWWYWQYLKKPQKSEQALVLQKEEGSKQRVLETGQLLYKLPSP